MADLAERITSLSPEQRALFELLRKEKRQPATNGIPRRTNSGPCPLSFGQQRIWFMEQWQPGTSAYNVVWPLRLRGPLEVPRLRHSLNQIIARHDALRTTVDVVEGQPVQVVADRLQLAIELQDTAGEAEALQCTIAEAEQPFDLRHNPLIRVRLLRLGQREHWLLIVMHHLIADGWSGSMLVREMAALYEGRSLPPLAIQYADFAQWQRDWLQGEVLEKQVAYWRERLDGAPALDLPTDRPPKPTPTGRGAGFVFEIPPELAEDLQAVSRQEGVTLFMTLLTGLEALLHRYTGQSDIVIGSPIAGRNRADVEPLIGFFVNNLVLRTDVSGDPGFRELLGRVRDVTLGAYANQDLPFEKLVEELQPERNLSRSPFFQVMFQLQNMPWPTIPMGDIQITPVERGSLETRFDLEFYLWEQPHLLWEQPHLAGVIQYNPDLFDAATIERLATHYVRVLKAGVTELDRPLSQLSLMTEPERQQVVVDWNRTATEYPKRSLQELFEDQAARTPEAIAVEYGDRRISYQELNCRANQLAHCLREHGVGPDAMVGLCIERSIEMVVGILGIVKAGGAYVPLDPAYPLPRLALMIEDTEAALVLTEARFRHLFAAPTFCLDTEWDIVAQSSVANPAISNTLEDLAYVIYTSGSTGVPKGVAVPHRAIVRLVKQTDYVQLRADDVVAQASNSSFDAITFELWGALLNGACLVGMSKDVMLSPVEFAAQLRQARVTTLFLTTALFNELSRQAPGAFGTLRHVLFGGEAVDPRCVREVLRNGPPARLLHVYGPTESTTFATWSLVEDVAEDAVTVPIGRPLANTRAYVFDRQGQVAPVGVPGELCIGGDGLARGYWRRPELTAERFVASELDPGGRVYRTGDLVRWRADGQIEFLGRIDQQVKIRGFRVEPGEIEAALLSHPDVRETAVVLRQDTGDKRLVAYWCGPATASELRTHLRERLPDYMVPAAFVSMEALPLNANGKIDRGALPAPTMQAETEIAPRTPMEEMIAGIWADLLRLEQCGVEENFFDLGGHSLLATQVISRVRRSFGVELPVRAVFEAPTVAGLAARVEAARGQRIADVPPLEPQANTGERPISFAQERLWFIEQLLPGNSAYNIPLVLRLEGALDVDRLRECWREVVRRHGTLRTAIPDSPEGRPVQVITEESAMPLTVEEVADQGEARQRAREEGERCFDLRRGPLVRVRLLRLAEREHWLLLTLHHIIGDGWSTGILVREIAALYEGRGLPALPLQYADYAAWQRKWLTGVVLSEQAAYWRERLRGAATLELPTDRPRPAVQTWRGSGQGLRISAELRRGLESLSRREGVTLFMTLLAGFQALLHRYTGQSDIVVGTPIANRRWSELEGLVGFFVNTLVLRTEVGGDPNFRELLSRVREVALGAYGHQDVPFEKLVEELQPERDMSRNPLFQVLFQLQNMPWPAGRMGEVEVGPAPVDSRMTRFDLELHMAETGEELAGGIQFNTDLWDAATMERLAEHYCRLLESAVANPELRLSELPLMGENERQQVMLEWNRTATEYPQRSLQELFEEQAAQTPEAIAVEYGDRRISYGELNRRTNQLAHCLRERGVAPDTMVGLCVERSIDMVVAILGIIKAGGAYVPLDPAYPLPRLELMLEDTQASLVLTEARFRHLFAAQALCLDSEWDGIAQYSAANPGVANKLEDLAYVIYTSGSTGIPKGVAVSQRAIVRLVKQTDFVQLQADDVVAQASNSSFDAITFELWGALLNGARLVGMSKDVMLSPVEFAAQLRQTRITTLFLTTALFNELSRQAPGAFRTLRHVLFGGEAVDARCVREVLRNGAPERLLHVYGPTESTTFATWFLVNEVAEDAVTVPIGRPIANTRIYVLDRQGQVAPVGVPGELCIGGDGLAREYWRRPELTAERFVASSLDPGGRLYRTGDLVRWRADGQIEFLGRIDQQVKIRGFRVEPGEIEAALLAHPDVDEAAVMLRQDTGDKRLVAYWCGPATAGELRAHLRERLPEYMVPAAFVSMEALPLNANGKIDRNALPAAPEDTSGGYVAPRTPVEELVGGIWSDLLQVSAVGVEDNFFDLGGHSLLATQLVSRVRRMFGVELPLQSIFKKPTLAAFAEYIEKQGSVVYEPIVPIQREGPLPLSFAQERLWFLDQLAPASAMYNVPIAFRLRGPLDVPSLEQAIRTLVQRHEVLRTSFPAGENRPSQIIAPQGAVRLKTIDLSGLTEADYYHEIERASIEPFDLAKGPLFRPLLFVFAGQDHGLLLHFHHTIIDGWSLQNLLRELAALYGGETLPEPGLQYVDFSEWQRRQADQGTFAPQLEYWKARLANLPSLDLPADRPRPAVQSYHGGRLCFDLPAIVGTRAKALGRREGATLFMTLLAAFQALLQRYVGHDDIVVGSAIAGRVRAETEGLLGCFVNTLALRTDLSGNPTFREALARVREVTLGAYTHQDLPFDKLVAEIRPDRHLSHTPIFQVMFSLQRAEVGELQLDGLSVSPVELATGTSKVDLLLAIGDDNGALRASFEYNTDLFDITTIERMRRHFETLLVAAMDNPDAHLAELPILDASEREQVMVDWNRTATEYPQRSLQELFEEQAERTPNAIAIEFEDQLVSYAELNRRANQVAHWLCERGVAPDTMVGLCAERGVEMLVGMLAIVKAGGAYVPLDPAYPQSRLDFMLEDTACALVLTQSRFRHLCTTAALCLDSEWEHVSPCSTANPAPRARPDDLAYLIYTSGSTGKPKAALIPQRGVVRLVKATNYVNLSSDEVILQFAPISFDASTFEIWGALLNGGRLVVFPPYTPSLEELGREIRNRGITTLWLTAGLFHQMIEEESGSLSGVRQLLAGGDALSAWHVREAQRQLPGCRLINGYGPTENTTFTCCADLSGEDVETSVPIGRPIANTRVYVLDKQGQVAPVGVPGELCIGGDGLARGYWRRPELTAERFVASALDPGGRLYRTGDLVRWRADGQIEFLGRIDQQVKIRGFRVEPGEIEAALLAHPDVDEAAVMLRQDTGDKRLVAYWCGPATASELRTHLRERLPEYMVPAAFVLMEALPLNANGKIDRSALPAAPEDTSGGYVAPRTPVEELVGGIWSDLLQVSAVGVEDNFFDLGGHSLLATQLVSRVRRMFGVELPLQSIFKKPTLAAFAETIERQGRAVYEPIVPIQREGPLPLSFAQERLWFLDQLAPASALYNVPIAFRLRGPLDVPGLAAAISALVERHEVLRTSFPASGNRPAQIIARNGMVDLPSIDLSGLTAADQHSEIERASVEPFDLANGPLFRPLLFLLGKQDYALLLSFHHTIIDGWSLRVLLGELAALYGGRSLPELGLQYVDFSEWQRRQAEQGTFAPQLEYWKERLAGLLPLDLPADRPRPVVQSYHGGRLGFDLSADAGSRAKELCRREGVTLFMTLLAAFQVLLHRYVRHDDIVVGTAIAGRVRAETEVLLGCFTNTLALRTNLSGNPTFRETLARVREVTLGAYAHQDLPFDKLVAEVRPDRHLSHMPLFQVMFSLQSEGVSELPLEGMRVSPIELDTGTVKVDLVLGMAEDNGALRASFEYNADLFDAATVGRMSRHFDTLLEAALANPDARLAELPMLDASERQQLASWNHTAADYPRERLIHELFEECACRAPQALAICSGPTRLTYGELNRHANRLAHYLRRKGVDAGTPVAVCLPRSAELVTALVAILKAGAAYVPLDVHYPQARLAYLLADSGAPVVISESRWREKLSGEVLCLDTDATEIERCSDANPIIATTPQDLVYIVYTSGSTGEPKGVAIEHRGLMNLVRWHQREYHVQPADRATQVASPAFDALGWELWPYLTAGASVHIPDEDLRIRPQQLATWLRQEAITLSFLPTPLAEAMLESAHDSLQGMALRALLTGGDRLHRSWTGLPFAFMNHYGPTESSVVTTWCKVEPEGGQPPIGRPIANTRIYVLDRQGQVAPVGVPGELCIGGDGLAREYWRRPELTAERFVASSLDPGGRLYRTGDLVRRRTDGQIEFLGRIDQQVKIRGFRVELGEIEAALLAHPGVRDAAVMLREDTGDTRLAAYWCGPATSAELRAHLRERLPDYMTPSAFVSMEALPLNPNGKIDRAALPAPELQAETEIAPRTPVEEIIARIWADLLGLERCGVEENFFDLGGHSLLATQVISRVRQSFGVELPLRALFEAPTVAGLAARVEAACGQGSPALPPLEPQAGTGEREISFAQERLWFIEQLLPGNPAYNIPFVLQLEGQLDIDRLRECWREIVRRHETLRIAITNSRDGRPVQVAAEESVISLSVEEVTGEEEARQRAKDEAEQCFDLRRGPLVRVRLLRLTPQNHWLLVTLHHIISDGWSTTVLMRELVSLYEGRPLPPLPAQYSDFAAWQRKWLSGAALQEQVTYWRDHVKGVSTLELPTDRPRPAVQSWRGAGQALRISAELRRGLEALSRREGVTLFMTLLAGFQALLHRYTGQSDIAVGTPIANRRWSAIEGMVGFFVNSLVLRTDLDGDPGFRELIGRVREVALGAYGHQDVPFEKLVEELQPERDMSRNPLFQVLFQLLNMPWPVGRMGDVEVSLTGAENRTARFDLEVHLVDAGEELEGRIQYSTELWDAPTMERLAEHYCQLLESAVANPEARLSELRLLRESEQRQVVVEWNQTTTELPRRSLQELVEDQVARTPDAIALEFENRRVSYRELNCRANRLAHWLRERGVGPDSLIGVCVERSPEMVAAVLGIIKAGGAYVPLDPSYPAERLKFMLDETQTPVLLSESKLAAQLPPNPAEMLLLDEAGQALAKCSDANPGVPNGREDLAYVIYTSGSTGRPKGVAMRRGGAGNLIAWQLRHWTIQEPIRTIQYAPLSFDVSFQEVFATLGSGGTLVLVAESARKDPVKLITLLSEARVERMILPFVALQQLAEAAVSRGLTCPLREILSSGEQLRITPQIVNWLKSSPGCVVTNQYGPTEAHVVSAYTLTGPPEEWPALPPIGRPIDNTRMYVLDAARRPVPIGILGELHYGGECLARGYLGRPELTAERFVDDPFVSGSRLYRSGDLARWRADGNLEYLGRSDQQVKIRGFRIEPGEIESVLAEHPAVQETRVFPRDTARGKELVAYVIPHVCAKAATPAELRQFLKGKLPDYMIPAAFVALDALPLTPSGKVDRRSLPIPDDTRVAGEEGFVAPRDSLEYQLATIWEDVLGVRPVSVRDNFFALGGHSILALQLFTRMEKALKSTLPLATLFEAPTIEQLAAILRRDGWQPRWTSLVPIQPTGGRPPFFFIHGVGGNVLTYRHIGRCLGANQPVYGLQAKGLDGSEPLQSIEEMAAHYVKEIRELQPHGPYHMGGLSFGGIVAFEMARQLEAMGEKVGLLAVLDAGRDELPNPNHRSAVVQRASFLLRRLEFHVDSLRRLRGSEKLAYFRKKIKTIRRRARSRIWQMAYRWYVGIGQPLPRALRDVTETNYLALRDYAIKPYSGEVVLFRAQNQGPLTGGSDDLGWGKLALGGIEIIEAPGEHLTMLSSLHAEAVGEKLRIRLERAQAECGGSDGASAQSQSVAATAP